MATGISKKETLVAVAEESTEGTYETPLGTEFVPVLEDGFEIAPAKELLDRSILVSSIGKPTPRVGEDSVTATLPMEFRASGTEGAAGDHDLLLKGALGASRSIAARVTTKTGNTSSQLEIQDADIGDFTVGDGICVLESGAHHLCAVTAVDTTGGSANITIAPAASGAFSDNVEISKSQIYHPADTGHPALSVSIYWANEILEKAIGCKVTSMSLENFSTGQLATLNFGLEGLNFTEEDGTFGSTVTYDDALPPVILSSCVYQDGTQIDVNNFSLSLANTLGFIRSTCNANGKEASRVVSREITGSFDPYKDDTSVSQFTNFDQQSTYSLIVTASIPSSTAGEIQLGSGIVIYLPSCLTTEKAVGDTDLILNEGISFRADRGSNGTTDEIFISLI